MLKYIIWAVVIYLIYKFVFELLVPVSKAATQMQDKIKEMQKAQQQQAEQQKTHQNHWNHQNYWNHQRFHHNIAL